MTSGEVYADYSQFELHPGAGGSHRAAPGVGLAWDGGENVVLTTAREYGKVPVTATFHEAPPSLDPAWDVVAELSITTGEEPAVTGWAGGGTIPLPVPENAELRVRYVVENAPTGWAGQPDDTVERYLLQLWREPPSAARVVVSRSPWSQYWAFGADAETAAREAAGRTEADRLVAVVDRALTDHPEVAARIRDGDARYHLGVVRYVQALRRHTRARYDDEAVARLIDERARVL